MKPRPFKYIAVRSQAELYDQLAEHGDDAKILAGGQSLVPMMNLRVASPAVILDINACPGLSGITRRPEGTRIGTLTRHCEVAESDCVHEDLPLITKAMPHVAHLAIRNRGTIGGSISHADPAAEMPACALLLDATFEVGSRRGTRSIPAVDFFQGAYTTSMRPDEALLSIGYPVRAENEVCSFLELSRRHGDFAIAGIAARAATDGQTLSNVAVVAFGLVDRPIRLSAVESLLSDTAAETSIEAIKTVLAGDVDPDGDINYSPETKIHLASELIRRVSVDLNQQREVKRRTAHG